LAHFRAVRRAVAEIGTEARRAAADHWVGLALARQPGACLAARLDVLDMIPSVPDEMGIFGLLEGSRPVWAHREQPQAHRARRLPRGVEQEEPWFSEAQLPERLRVLQQQDVLPERTERLPAAEPWHREQLPLAQPSVPQLDAREQLELRARRAEAKELARPFSEVPQRERAAQLSPWPLPISPLPPPLPVQPDRGNASARVRRARRRSSSSASSFP